jgi:hypothetical protein
MSKSDEDKVGTTKPEPIEWLRDIDTGGDKGTKREVGRFVVLRSLVLIRDWRLEESAVVDIEWAEVETRPDSRKGKYYSWKWT